MKIPTHEAAKELRIHPANLLLSLAEMASLQDSIWPEVEDGYIETLRLTHRERFPRRTPTGSWPVQGPQHEKGPAENAQVVSQAALRIIDKLWRKDKWNVASVAIESLEKMTHLEKEELRTGIHELLSRGFILSGHGRDGPYSLNPKRKAEIDATAERSVQDSNVASFSKQPIPPPA